MRSKGCLRFRTPAVNAVYCCEVRASHRFQEWFHKTGTIASVGDVCHLYLIKDTGVCSVIGIAVKIIIENRLDLTRCIRHGVSQTEKFSINFMLYRELIHLVSNFAV